MKKKSIREYVSEEELRFELYVQKYSRYLNSLEIKTKEEIIQEFEHLRNKQLTKIEKDLEDTKNNKEALLFNRDYLLNQEPMLTESSIITEFEKLRSDFINVLQESTKKNKDFLLEYAKNVKLSSKVSKERFGTMLLLIIKNMGTMPSFAGYTDNWKTDFYSNAIEHTLLYAHNYDENLRSKRSGEKSKAFAYITQVCYNAFVAVINERKKDSEMIVEAISYETYFTENIHNTKHYESKAEEKYTKYHKECDSIEDIFNVIKYVEDSNQRLKNLKNYNSLDEYDKEYFKEPIELLENKHFTDVIIYKNFILPLDFTINSDLNVNIRSGKIKKESIEEVTKEEDTEW
jgi:hypothetical protein